MSQWIVKPGHDELYMLESQGSWFSEPVSLSESVWFIWLGEPGLPICWKDLTEKNK